MNKLALGTVQFGLDYGISNQGGQVRLDEVGKILEQARESGITTLDTAIAYGNSEAVLGKVGVKGFRVISKLPGFTEVEAKDLQGWSQRSIDQSLQRLGISKLDGLLLHNPIQLQTSFGEELVSTLEELKRQGYVDSIGVSVYSIEEIELALNLFAPDLIQAPFNLLDRRLLSLGLFEDLKRTNVEIHTRSAFMQGLLLMGKQRPAKFSPWQALFERYESWLKEHALTELEACISYPVSLKHIDKVVVGVNSSAELQQIVSAINPDLPIPPDSICSTDENLINPSNWNNL